MKEHTESKILRNKWHLKVESLIKKGEKNPQYLKQTIFAHVKAMNDLYRGIKKRKLQNIRDHNLIELFKEKYSDEFKICLLEYETMYGKDKKK